MKLATVDDVMAWADDLTDIPEILPALKIGDDGSPTVLMPWDEGYAEALASPPPAGSTP